MIRKQSRAHPLRVVVELVFLVLFGFLFLRGSIQLWLGIFAAGVLLSIFFSRVYCGWVCPMNTIFRPITWLRSKLGIRPLKTPRFMTNPAVRVIFLVLFVASMLLAKRLKEELPLPALITGLSVLVVLFFEEALWHNAMCPYGTILSLSSRMAPKHYRVEDKACISCGKCQKVCPVYVIDTLESGKRSIRKSDCLACGACAEACPAKAIRFE